MKVRLQALACLTLILLLTGAHAQSDSLKWKQLPPLPDSVGFAGAFAGVSDGALIVAGGANFPGKMPWEGGTKVWHDTIFVLPKPDGQWITGFKLPHPLGYGVSATTAEGLLCAGGSDARKHFRDVFLLRWHGGEIEIKSLPLLPRPVANGAGALAGHTFYIAGGIEKPDATTALKIFWSLDLDAPKPQWRELEPWPGPARMLAVAGAGEAVAGGIRAAPTDFFLFSGVELAADADHKPVRHYLNDAYRLRPGQGWTRLPDLPRAAASAPSPAVFHNGKLLIISGDDGRLAGVEPKSAHPGFPKEVLAFDLEAQKWTRLGDCPFSRATAPVVEWESLAVIPNGEEKPGRRTPEVWALQAPAQ